MQLEQHQTTSTDTSMSGPQMASAMAQKGERHKAIIRISQSGFFSSLESDSKWWILAMTFIQGIFAVVLILGAIFLWKLF